MRLLISARANLTCGILAEQAVTAAAIANDPEGVRILCEARCDPTRPNRLNMHAIDAAAALGASVALEELFMQARHDFYKVNLSNSLHWAMSFSPHHFRKLLSFCAQLIIF